MVENDATKISLCMISLLVLILSYLTAQKGTSKSWWYNLDQLAPFPYMKEGEISLNLPLYQNFTHMKCEINAKALNTNLILNKTFSIV